MFELFQNVFMSVHLFVAYADMTIIYMLTGLLGLLAFVGLVD